MITIKKEINILDGTYLLESYDLAGHRIVNMKVDSIGMRNPEYVYRLAYRELYKESIRLIMRPRPEDFKPMPEGKEKEKTDG